MTGLTTDQILSAFKPSRSMKDWQLRSDGDGNWFYEQYVRFYDPAHKAMCAGGLPDCAKRKVGSEPYYDLTTKKIVDAPRVYIDHYPQKGEWEHFKAIDDVIASNLYKEMVHA